MWVLPHNFFVHGASIINNKVLAYYQDTQFFGVLPEGAATFTECLGVKGQGDVMEISLALDASLSQIVTARFRVYGSLYAIASAAYLVETIQDQDVSVAKQMTAADIIEFFSLPPQRHHCAFRAVDVLRKSLRRWCSSRMII